MMVRKINDHGEVITISKWGSETVCFADRSDESIAAQFKGMRLLCDFFQEKFGLTLFVVYGALLGSVRAGDFIPHDDDVDLTYISRFSDPGQVLLESRDIVRSLIDAGFRVQMESYGQYKVYLTVDGRDVKVEIFISWISDDNYWLYFAVPGTVRSSDILPLGTCVIRGEEFPAPACAQALLTAIYGDNWHTPDPGFSFDIPYSTWQHFERLFCNHNRQHWDSYYERKQETSAWSMVPSQFAAFVAQHLPERVKVLDVGCGNGRDSVFFASVGHDITGVDYSTLAVEHCDRLVKEKGFAATFSALNIYDISQVLRFAKTYAGEFDAIYARFFLHAVTELGEDQFIILARRCLRSGGLLAIEFRTTNDPRAQRGTELSETERIDGHYRRFIEPEVLSDKLIQAGFVIDYSVRGQGMAKFRDEDPEVCRILGVSESEQSA